MSAEQLTPRPLSVLLVEDNPDDALLLVRHLKRNGFAPTVVRVDTPHAMRDALAGEQLPDVVLADYNLPEFSGPAALKMLRELRVDVPFIMLSGVITEEIAVSSMRAGAQDYVSKQNLARLAPALERELNELASRRRERAAQQALKASEYRFDRLVAAMPLGLVICDASQRIVYANGTIERMLRYPEGGLRPGSSSLETIFSDAQRVLDAVRDPERYSRLFESCCRLHEDGDGTQAGTLDVLVGVAELTQEGAAGERQIAVFVADLSMQKRSEEALRRTEKLAVAGRLAAAIAHEINNPLEAITNCLYLVGQLGVAEEGRQYLEAAQSELNRVSQITVQTLKFHRSSTHARATDLHELVDTVVRLLSLRFRHHGIEVEQRFGELPLITVYDGEIRQLIANLVNNAIDALQGGGRMVIHTRAGRDWKTGTPGVYLMVADDGVGMDAATQKRIFEPFFSTKETTGTGLGLWISQEILGKQGGWMRMKSRKTTEERRGGTVFQVFLPVEAAR
ncbi:MAG TPA: ATP-binding protein [Acidobacteriaceae bacterium]